MRYARIKKKKRKLWVLPLCIIIGWGLIIIGANMLTNTEDEKEYSARKLATESTYSEKTVENQAENSAGDEEVTIMLENVNNAIVGISRVKGMGSAIFFNNVELNMGTGFIVAADGYIVSNAHVTGEKYSTCYVTLENGSSYTGNVVWSNANLDLSIVKIGASNLKYVNLGDSDSAKIGKTVYAIGNPIGFEFQRTVTSGIVSAVDRTLTLEENGTKVYMSDLIQTDATINSGNSGGPLINPNGEVLGVNSIKITSAEGIGFAIPINVIKPIVKKLVETGNFEEATLGIEAFDKNVIPYLKSDLNFTTGIYVADVINGSVAEAAGILVGDIITKIDNRSLNKMNELKAYIYGKNPGDEVVLVVLRDNNLININVRLGT